MNGNGISNGILHGFVRVPRGYWLLCKQQKKYSAFFFSGHLDLDCRRVAIGCLVFRRNGGPPLRWQPGHSSLPREDLWRSGGPEDGPSSKYLPTGPARAAAAAPASAGCDTQQTRHDAAMSPPSFASSASSTTESIVTPPSVEWRPSLGPLASSCGAFMFISVWKMIRSGGRHRPCER